MTKETQSDKIIKGLINRGCKEIPSKSRKYRKFERPDTAETFYFVGRKGALRVGKNISSSISLTRRLY